MATVYIVPSTAGYVPLSAYDGASNSSNCRPRGYATRVGSPYHHHHLHPAQAHPDGDYGYEYGYGLTPTISAYSTPLERSATSAFVQHHLAHQHQQRELEYRQRLARARAIALERERERERERQREIEVQRHRQRQRELQLLALERERQRQRQLRINAARRQAILREYSRQREAVEVNAFLEHVLASVFASGEIREDGKQDEAQAGDQSTQAPAKLNREKVGKTVEKSEKATVPHGPAPLTQTTPSEASDSQPHVLDRDQLAREAISQANHFLRNRADVTSFESAFSDLFQHIFGGQGQEEEEEAAAADGSKVGQPKDDSTTTADKPSGNAQATDIPILSRSPSPSPSPSAVQSTQKMTEDPAEEVPLAPYSVEVTNATQPASVIESTTTAKEHAPVRPSSPTLSVHSASSGRSSRSSLTRKAAHVRDADENGEEILLPEDTRDDDDDNGDDFVELRQDGEESEDGEGKSSKAVA